jgi:hypothetical protein
MALEVGSRLGHYEVTALIGEGGTLRKASQGVSNVSRIITGHSRD